MMKNKSQQGFLLLAAVIIIVIVGLFAGTLVYMFTSSTVSSTNYLASKQALYIAESGLHRTLYDLFKTDITVCNSISGQPNYTNISFGQGKFTVTATQFNPAPASLVNTINSAQTVIPISSTNNYAAQGIISIDSESMSYLEKSSDPAVCSTVGSIYCLTGVVRGKFNSAPIGHLAGSLIKQNQCSLISEGGVSNLVNPTGKRAIKEIFAQVPTSEIWAVGTNGTILYWDSSTWSSVASGTANHLRAISMLDNYLGFAVGDNGTIVRYNGTSWQPVTSGTGNDLNDVFVASHNRAWAVGDNGKILRWNGATWQSVSSIPPVSDDLEAIDMLNNGSRGFAVGEDGTILYFNGSNWIKMTSPTSQDLYDIAMVSSIEAWAVGKKSQGSMILIWNGSTWTRDTSSSSNIDLNTIDMLDTNNNGHANTGWAYGSGGHHIQYNGSTWEPDHVHGGTIHGMIMLTQNEHWIVGQGNNRISHWVNGSWTDYRPSNERFYSVATLRNGKKIMGTWSEDVK